VTDVPAAGSINAHVTPAAAAGIAVAAGDPGSEEEAPQDAWCAQVLSAGCRSMHQ